ncbi:MAG: 3-isopropylmalate dehydratase small subunit [Phascolarctobacterium sp.]|nr:3-isopropylmalate dehydratase small subunit [Phascolarctobacterium sp.]
MSKVWRYKDHVDTDVIIPARYLNIADFNELAEHAMEDSKENLEINFAANVQPGDYIVAGKNFGCGSSREHAPIVIKVKGIKCIIADSFARIFYRNAINIGLPVLEIGSDVEKIEAGDEIDVDMAKGEIKILNKGIIINTKPLPEFIQKISDCGGLINYIKGAQEQ